MTESDQEKEDDVLRRMLNSPPRPHKPIGLTPMKPSKPNKAHKKSAPPKPSSKA